MATVSHQPRVVILKFEDKNRYGRYGVACNILFGTNRKCVVDCEQHHQETSQLKRNQWALITLPESNELRNPKESLKGELVEIWGPVGDYAVELKAYQRHFGVLPCEYPSRENWMLDLPIFEPLNELSNTSSNDLTSLLSLRGLSEFDSFFKIHCIDKDNFKTLSFTSIFPSIEPEKLQALKKLSYDMRKHDALNNRVDIRHLKKYTFSIDNEDTKDVDDALSVEFNEDGSVRLGIHIADVASHIPCHSKLFQWAQMRAASVYFDEMKPSSPKSSLSAACNDDEENIDSYGSSCPMLPHSLAHDHLSLNQDVERNAISLWLHFDSTGNQTRAPYHQRTLIMNGCKTSYASFESTTDDYLSKARDFIEGLSGSNEAEVQVAWSMVTYNSYFAQVMLNLDKQGQSSNSVDEDKSDDDEEVPPLPPSSPPLKRSTSSESTLFSGSVNDVVGILSVQQEGKGEEGSPIAASYRALTKGMICKGDLVDFKHFGLDKPVYAHCSSPIRRFVDLFNQHAVYGTLRDGEYIENTFMKDEETLQQTMEELNSTYVNIKHFHATVDSMKLAYLARETTIVCSGKVKIEIENNSSMVTLNVHNLSRKVTIPLNDSYFADPIIDSMLQDEFDGGLELHGVLVKGRQRLRLRLTDHDNNLKVNTKMMKKKEEASETIIQSDESSDGAEHEVGSPLSLLGSASDSRVEPADLSPQALWPCLFCSFRNDFEATSCTSCGIMRNRVERNQSSLEEPPLNQGEDEMFELPSALSLSSLHRSRSTPLTRNEHQSLAQQRFNSEDLFGELSRNGLTEQKVNEVLGFNIDSFQARSLAVVRDPEKDLLVLASTGSGKTVIGLIAVLQAFARGKKAIYTAPVKALSNQKYSEFQEWFKDRGVDADVSLLTGDARIRPPPGCKNEMIICTSEILRNKLLKASGSSDSQFFPSAFESQAGMGEGGGLSGHEDEGFGLDIDLDDLGCVVMDEVHYIKDEERGNVWEETLMHIAPTVQLVALSATLKDPELFLEWIQIARKRKAEMICQKERYVPLHFGVLDMETSKFDEFYCTSSDTEEANFTHLKGLFKETGYHVLRRNQQQGREKRSVDIKYECTHLGNQLLRNDMFPAVVFCMSRSRCVEMAKSIVTPTLLVDTNTFSTKNTEANRQKIHDKYLGKFMPKLGELQAYKEIMALLKKGIAYHHGGMLPVLREFVELCFQARLIRIIFATETLAVGVNMPTRTVVFSQLDKRDQNGNRSLRSDEFWQMAGRAGRRGMDGKGYVVLALSLSVLDIDRKANYLKETAMNNICGDLPCVSSQLKVDNIFVLRHLARGHGSEVTDLTLFSEEHRRRNVELSKKIQECFDAIELQQEETGAAAAAADDDDSLDSQFQKMSLTSSVADDEAFLNRLSQSELFSTQKQIEAVEKIILEFKESRLDLTKQYKKLKRLKRENEILKNSSNLKMSEQMVMNGPKIIDLKKKKNLNNIFGKILWNQRIEWLTLKGFIRPANCDSSHKTNYEILPKGKACAAFGLEYSFVLGTIIHDGYLEKLSFAEICGWISLFLDKSKIVNNTSTKNYQFPELSDSLQSVCEATDMLREEFYCELRIDPSDPSQTPFTHAMFIDFYGPQIGDNMWRHSKIFQEGSLSFNPFNRKLTYLVLDWVQHKDFNRVASWVNASLLGDFVVAILRIITFFDVIKEVALGLGQFEVHNKLDGYVDRLLSDFVTNDSLYI